MNDAWKAYHRRHDTGQASARIGIVSHLIADFFCLPHHHEAVRDSSLHKAYEAALDRHADSVTVEDYIKKQLDCRSRIKPGSHIVDYIADRYNRHWIYAKSQIRSSPERDFRAAVGLATTAALEILTNKHKPCSLMGIRPRTSSKTKDLQTATAPRGKSQATALVLSILLGPWGVDRFYLGHVGLGLLKGLITLVAVATNAGGVMGYILAIGMATWWVSDIFLIATGKLKNQKG